MKAEEQLAKTFIDKRGQEILLRDLKKTMDTVDDLMKERAELKSKLAELEQLCMEQKRELQGFVVVTVPTSEEALQEYGEYLPEDGSK